MFNKTQIENFGKIYLTVAQKPLLLIQVCESSIELSNIKSLNVNTLMFQPGGRHNSLEGNVPGLPYEIKDTLVYCHELFVDTVCVGALACVSVLAFARSLVTDYMEAICSKWQHAVLKTASQIFYEFAKKLSVDSCLPSAFIKCAVF